MTEQAYTDGPYRFHDEIDGGRVYITEQGMIGIERGGTVYVMSPKQWHRFASAPAVSLPTEAVEETQLIGSLHAERIDILARMVQELRGENARLTLDRNAAWANGNTLRAELEQVKWENEKMRGALIRWHQSNETDGFIGADEALAKLAAELAE